MFTMNKMRVKKGVEMIASDGVNTIIQLLFGGAGIELTIRQAKYHFEPTHGVNILFSVDQNRALNPFTTFAFYDPIHNDRIHLTVGELMNNEDFAFGIRQYVTCHIQATSVSYHGGHMAAPNPVPASIRTPIQSKNHQERTVVDAQQAMTAFIEALELQNAIDMALDTRNKAMFMEKTNALQYLLAAQPWLKDKGDFT